MVEALRSAAQVRPEQEVFRFVAGDTEEVLNIAELEIRARAIAAVLQKAGASNERVLLLFAPGKDFVLALYACFFANAIAVPAYPPDISRLARTLPRLRHIIVDSESKFVLTSGLIKSLAEGLREELPQAFEREWISVDEVSNDAAVSWVDPNVREDTIAFLQYTSGSTSAPRGVVIRHSNILANSALICESHGLNEQTVGVSWLPLFHDMGLIGHVLAPLWAGGKSVLLDPLEFLQNPSCWLSAISKYRGTIAGAPNFGYGLCTKRIEPESIANLSLESWAVAYCGAEPIRAETLSAFSRKFRPFGFKKSAFLCCYGLAEATLIISGGQQDDSLVGENFSATALARREVRPAIDGEKPVSLVQAGSVLSTVDVRIVDPATSEEVKANSVGEIWVAGATVSSGYWRVPEVSSASFGAALKGDTEGRKYLRTGDLGFLKGKMLYVAGRIKDIIILRGRNYYPQDLELAYEKAHIAVRRGSSATFGIEVAGEERIVVVAEVERRAQPDRRGSADSSGAFSKERRGVERRQAPVVALEPVAAMRGSVQAASNEAICQAVRKALIEECDVRPYAIVLVKPGSIPKTSSGKIQRSATKAAFLEGTLDELFRDEDGDELGSLAPAGSAEPSRGSVLTLARLSQMAPEQRPDQVRAYLVAELATALRVSPSVVPYDRPLRELGLDSVAAVEVAYRIERELGVVGLTNALLAGATVTGIAAQILDRVRNMGAGTLHSRTASATGGLPLLPSQSWFFSRAFARPEFWNLMHGGIIFSCPPGTRGDYLSHAIADAARRHEQLRVKFENVDGQFIQRVVPVESLTELFATRDLSHLNSGDADALIRDEANALQKSLSLESGTLLKMRHYFMGPDHPGRLVFAVHHLVADVISFNILAEDVERSYRAQVAEEADVSHVQVSASTWLGKLEQFAASPEILGELPYWVEVQRQPSERLKLDHPEGRNIGADSNVRVVHVPAELDERLKTRSAGNPVFTHDVLLGALVASLRSTLDAKRIHVQLLSSGRRLLEDVDPKATLGRRVIGWFANYFPAYFDVSSCSDETAVYQVVKDSMAKMPRRGDGYGLLRYLCPDVAVRTKLRREDVPDVMFEYVGNTGLRTTKPGDWFNVASDLPIQTRSELNSRQFLLTVIAGYVGTQGLLIRLSYSRAIFDDATIDRLVADMSKNLKTLL